MNFLTDLTTGERIAFVRERRKITQADFAVQMGVNVIYISQVENNHRPPGRRFIHRAAKTLGTSIGFLERETENTAPPGSSGIPDIVYFSAEADEAARLIDAVPADARSVILGVVLAMAAQAGAQNPQRTRQSAEPETRRPAEPETWRPWEAQELPLPERNEFARRLVESETAPVFGGLVRS